MARRSAHTPSRSLSLPSTAPGSISSLFQTRPLGLAPHPVASRRELKHRLMAAMEFFNGDLVVHTWTYKFDKWLAYDVAVTESGVEAMKQADGISAPLLPGKESPL